MKPALRYSPDLETLRDDEAEGLNAVEEGLATILSTTLRDEGRGLRAVHAKAHAYLTGTLSVLPDLPPELAQGMFATPGNYPAILRVSTNPGDVLDDSISLPRGIALKVLGVEGPRLPGAEGDAQDFLMVNAPVFASPDPADFARSLKLLALTTDRLEWAKKALSLTLRTVERGIEAVGLESRALKSFGGALNVHPLGERYFSTVPFRHGDYVAKYALVPVSDTLTRHSGEEIATIGHPDAIRAAMDRDTRAGAMTWELCAQLMRDPETMPVEDPRVEWPEDESPLLPVARLRVEAQPSFDAAAARAADDRLRFSVWTGLAAHRPLGAINRARRDAYLFSTGFRERANRCPIHEPTDTAIGDMSHG